MRAIVVNQFGGPDVLQAGQAERPAPGPGELLVRVQAAGVGHTQGKIALVVDEDLAATSGI